MNPIKNFDIDGCLRRLNTAPELVAWAVNGIGLQMEQGDQVFVWRANPNPNTRGIIAEFVVERPVEKMPADHITAEFSPSNDGPSIMDRVQLRVQRIAKEDVTLIADTIRGHDKILDGVGPLGFHAATNYRVTADQSRLLNDLWALIPSRPKP